MMLLLNLKHQVSFFQPVVTLKQQNYGGSAFSRNLTLQMKTYLECHGKNKQTIKQCSGDLRPTGHFLDERENKKGLASYKFSTL